MPQQAHNPAPRALPGETPALTVPSDRGRPEPRLPTPRPEEKRKTESKAGQKGRREGAEAFGLLAAPSPSPPTPQVSSPFLCGASDRERTSYPSITILPPRATNPPKTGALKTAPISRRADSETWLGSVGRFCSCDVSGGRSHPGTWLGWNLQGVLKRAAGRLGPFSTWCLQHGCQLRPQKARKRNREVFLRLRPGRSAVPPVCVLSVICITGQPRLRGRGVKTGGRVC